MSLTLTPVAPSQGVPVDDLRGIREHADASPVLLDPSGARARKLGRAGRVVGSVLTAWLVALMFAGLGLIPANLIPFGAFVQNNLIPQGLISSDHRDDQPKPEGTAPTMRASAGWYAPATTGNATERPADLLERRAERRDDRRDHDAAGDSRPRAAGATAPAATADTVPAAATTQPVSGGEGAAPAPAANPSAPKQAADHPAANPPEPAAAPSSDASPTAAAPSNASSNRENGAANANAAAGSNPAGTNDSGADSPAGNPAAGAPNPAASPAAADALTSAPGRSASPAPGQAKKRDAGSQGE